MSDLRQQVCSVDGDDPVEGRQVSAVFIPVQLRGTNVSTKNTFILMQFCEEHYEHLLTDGIYNVQLQIGLTHG